MRKRRPLNNFGDLIGPVLVRRIKDEFGLHEPLEQWRLVAVGSIMRLAERNDVVWGSGVNGRSMDLGAAPDLDVRAVRGPRTRNALMGVGTLVPEIYGDPGLLWSRYWSRDYYLSGPDAPTPSKVGIVPNHNDKKSLSGTDIIDPIGQPHDVIRQIAACDFVCGSSLHGVVLAESLGIPARLIRSVSEPAFKYDDYYEGTGRDDYRVAGSVQEAIAMGGERPPVFDAEALLSAFPADLYLSE